ncbi:hypothetical protein WAE60_06370 [Caulobacter sp. CCG-8]
MIVSTVEDSCAAAGAGADGAVWALAAPAIAINATALVANRALK